jgi:hypothetical protein
MAGATLLAAGALLGWLVMPGAPVSSLCAGEKADAELAKKVANTLNPQYADPYHNLADLLDQVRQVKEAQRLWRVYLRLEPQGQWAEYAKQRLTALTVQSG